VLPNLRCTNRCSGLRWLPRSGALKRRAAFAALANADEMIAGLPSDPSMHSKYHGELRLLPPSGEPER